MTFVRGRQFFDEAFAGWGCEDNEYAYRIWRKKTAIVYGLNAFAYHVDGIEENRDPFYAASIGRKSDFSSFIKNRRYFISKHGKNRVLRELLRKAIAKPPSGLAGKRRVTATTEIAGTT